MSLSEGDQKPEATKGEDTTEVDAAVPDRNEEGDEIDGQEEQDGREAVHQENLFTRVVAFDNKSYYLDVRENSRGKYLKLTESSPRRRSTILLSGYVMRALLQVLEDAIKENYTPAPGNDDKELDNHWETIFSRRVLSMQKKIYIDLMQNKRGRSLNVAEVSVNRPKTSVVMSERGWFQFKRALEDIQAKFPELNNGSASGANNTNVVKTQNPNQGNKGRKEKAEGDEEAATKVLASKSLSLPSKRFFFDLLSNDLGSYLKISELRRTKRETIFVPSVCFPVFVELLDKFSKDDFESAVEGTDFVEFEQEEEETEPSKTPNQNQQKTLTRRSLKVEDSEGSNGRKYNIDLRENQYGKFLRVTEVRANRTNCVFFPHEYFQQISEIFSQFNE